MSFLQRLLSFVRRRKRLVIILAVVAVVIGGGIALLKRPAQPQYVTAPAQRGDLVQTVEAVGTVTSEHDLELRFSVSGIIETVDVKEGDRVQAGQQLAHLRAGSLGASVAAQAASLQQALADLHQLEEGARPEDIAITEADVANKQAALQAAQANLQTATSNLDESQKQLAALQQEAQTSLSGQISTAKATLSSQLVTAENALSTIDDTLSKTIIQDAIVKAAPGQDSTIQIQGNLVRANIQAVRTHMDAATDYQDALKVVQDAQGALQEASGVLQATFNLISSLPDTVYFSGTDREAYKNTIATQRTAVQTAISLLSSAYSAFQTAAAGYDTRIVSEQSSIEASKNAKQKAQIDILTYQTALQSQQAALALKKAGARDTELESARARVRLQQATLARAQADYGETILRAPIDGIVTKVNVKLGEALPAGAAVTLLGDSPFRVEMYVSEIDIPKVQIAQSGSIELDAFRGTPFKMHVSSVDTASTDRDGVSKYRVLLGFDYKHDSELKIGMTGDAAIITGMRQNVVSVPLRSVLEDSKGQKIVRILEKDNKTVEERPVVTGMEGASGNVEVVSGVQEGETIIVLIKP